MVKTGHSFRTDRTDGMFPYLQFRNPDRAQLDVQITRYSSITAQWPPGTAGAVHRTNFHQLLLITEGTGRAMIDFVDVRCRPGTLMHVYPGRAVRLPQAAKGALPIDADLILFTPTFLPRWDGLTTFTDPFRPAFWNLTPKDRSELDSTMDLLSDEYRNLSESPVTDDLGIELMRHLLAAHLLRIARSTSRLSSDVPTSPAATRNTIFQRFLHELEVSFASTRKAEEYASRLGYSLRTLNRACDAATGTTAKAIINARVTLEAKRQLAHTELPASTIGRQLGFSEAANFGKFFTFETNSTPGEFRRKERRRSAAIDRRAT